MQLRWLAFLFVLAGAAPVQAYCLLTTEMPMPGDRCAETGAPLAWQRQCLSYSLMEREQAQPSFERVRDVTDLSFSTWMDVRCGTRPIGLDVGQTQAMSECADPEYNVSSPNANSILFVQDWSARELPEDAFGLTLVWHNPDSGQIYDADMQINETLGTLGICNTVCPQDMVDLQNVVTHEAGHFFGLGHSSVMAATMSARARVGETAKRDLADDDRAGLCAIYGELAVPRCSEGDFMPDNGFSAECWGGDRGVMSRRSDCSAAGAGALRSGAPAGVLLLLAVAALVRRRSVLVRAGRGSL